jgi:2-phosphosulfolactate phosphatase
LQGTVVIDCFPESVHRYRRGYAVVAVDVVRTTTTAISTAAAGRRCFPVLTIEAAWEMAKRLQNPLLVGEQNGTKPAGFDLNNSPSQLMMRRDVHRPAVLLSSSGTRLCHEAFACEAAFAACLRNYSSVASHLAGKFRHIAVIGAGSRRAFREEDQLCCAWIAEHLISAGYTAENNHTLALIRKWQDKPADAWLENQSASYLRSSGQAADLDFILRHIDDLAVSYALRNGEVASV